VLLSLAALAASEYAARRLRARIEG